MTLHRRPRHARPRQWLTTNTRRRLYLIASAVIPLAGAYGLISDTTAPLWGALAYAALVAPLAAAHTPRAGANE